MQQAELFLLRILYTRVFSNVLVWLICRATNGDLGSLSQELSILLREKLLVHHVFTMADMRRIYQTKLAQCGPGHILGTGVSDNLLEKTVLTVGATKVGFMVSSRAMVYMQVQK